MITNKTWEYICTINPDMVYYTNKLVYNRYWKNYGRPNRVRNARITLINRIRKMDKKAKTYTGYRKKNR